MPKSHRRHPAGIFQRTEDNLLKSKCFAEEHDYTESIRINMAGFQRKPSWFPAIPGCLSLGLLPNLFLQVLRTFRLHNKISTACQAVNYLIIHPLVLQELLITTLVILVFVMVIFKDTRVSNRKEQETTVQLENCNLLTITET